MMGRSVVYSSSAKKQKRTAAAAAGDEVMQDNEGDDAALVEEENEEDNDPDSYVHCFLNVTPVPYAKEGFVCVAVGTFVRAKNSNVDVKNLYVYPQDIKLSENLQEWEASLPHVVV